MASNYPGGFPAGRNPGGFTRASGFAGSRGTGAIVTQIVLQLLMQYRSDDLERLSADIKKLQAQAVSARQVEAQARANVLAFNRAQADTQAAYNKIANYNREIWKDIVRLQKDAALEEKINGQATLATKQALAGKLASLEANHVINQSEVTLLTNQNALVEQQAIAERALANASANRLGLEAAVTEQLTLQTALQEFANRQLAGLGRVVTAAIGATIGAAIVYQPLMDVLNATAAALKQLVDPAQAASDALSDVADQIERIASDRAISNLDTATALLKSLNIPGATNLAGSLAQAPQVQALQEQSVELQKITDYLIGREQLEQQINNLDRYNAGILKLQAEGHQGLANILKSELNLVNLLPGGLTTTLQLVKGLGPALSFINPEWGAMASHAQEIFDKLFPLPGTMGAITQSTQEAADAYADLAQQARDAAINAAFDTQEAGIQAASDARIAAAQSAAETTVAHIRDSAENAVNQIQATASSRIDALQKRITAIGNQGPSERTNNLAAAIERLNKAEQDRRFNAQLADINEQKHLILLQQRLALTNEEINLNDYQGKSRLIAIDALLDRMQKQNAAQDRFNKLLDIQYQINQGVRRQQGETIQDFIARRAQYYRQLLEQAADLKRQGPEDELKAEKERVQTTLELRDLESRRTELLRQRAHDAQLKRLQDELKASQDADRRAAESAQQRLRDRIEAIRRNASDSIAEINRTRDADIAAANAARDRYIADQKARTDAQLAQLKQQRDDALRWANAAEGAKYAAAVNGAENISQLNEISGALAGANFSEAYVEAQLRALGLKPGDSAYDSSILGFRNALKAYQGRFDRLQWSGVGGNLGGLIQPAGTHAAGGIIPLTNSMNLGQDIRIGEGGPEGGLMTSQGIAVLNNEIMEQLRQRDNRSGMFAGATFNTTGTGDPYNDRYAMEQMIERVVRKVIN